MRLTSKGNPYTVMTLLSILYARSGSVFTRYRSNCWLSLVGVYVMFCVVGVWVFPSLAVTSLIRLGSLLNRKVKQSERRPLRGTFSKGHKIATGEKWGGALTENRNKVGVCFGVK